MRLVGVRPTEEHVEQLFNDFVPMQLACFFCGQGFWRFHRNFARIGLKTYSRMITGAVFPERIGF